MNQFISQLFEEGRRIKRGLKNLRFFKFANFLAVLKALNRNERLALLILAVVLVADLATMGVRFYVRNTVSVAAFGADYTEGEVGFPEFINPLLAQTQTDKDLTALVYAGLFKFDGQNHLIPDLATDQPQFSSDEKTFSVKLRPNLKWSDGQPLNADDVVFTVQTLQDPAFKSPLRSQWASVTVQKIDDQTIQFKSKSVSAPFLTNLVLGILPKHIWSNVSADQFTVKRLNLQPVGSGPYFVKEIRNSGSGELQSMTFESYSNYWAGKPYIDNIKVNFYENYDDALLALHSKEIQGFGFIPFDTKVNVDPKTTLQVSKLPVYEYQAVFFNLSRSHAVLGDPTVRTALAQSVDRQKIIDDVYQGLALPDYGPIMPGQIGYNPDIEKINGLNLDAAKAALDKAGWVVDNSTGIRHKGNSALAFTITTSDFALNQKTAEALRDQWRTIGADVQVQSIANRDIEKQTIRPRNYDALLFAESTGADPDPFVFWHSSQANDPGFNLAQYKNTAADSVISDAHNTFDPAVRTKDYQDFQTIFAADEPAVFIDQSVFVYELTPEIKGVQLQALANPEDRFYDIVHWYISTKRVFK